MRSRELGELDHLEQNLPAGGQPVRASSEGVSVAVGKSRERESNHGAGGSD